MVWQWTNNCFAHWRRLIVLCSVLLSLTPADVAAQSFETNLTLTSRAPIVAATPLTTSTLAATHPDGEAERPNAVRRFFSWVIQGISRPFKRRPQVVCTLPPSVSIQSSNSTITKPCPDTKTATSTVNCPAGSEVTLTANATDPDMKLLYTWFVSGGHIRGEGRTITWDLGGVPAGSYTATVEVNDGNQLTAAASTTVTVTSCTDCERPAP